MTYEAWDNDLKLPGIALYLSSFTYLYSFKNASALCTVSRHVYCSLNVFMRVVTAVVVDSVPGMTSKTESVHFSPACPAQQLCFSLLEAAVGATGQHGAHTPVQAFTRTVMFDIPEWFNAPSYVTVLPTERWEHTSALLLWDESGVICRRSYNNETICKREKKNVHKAANSVKREGQWVGEQLED